MKRLILKWRVPNRDSQFVSIASLEEHARRRAFQSLAEELVKDRTLKTQKVVLPIMGDEVLTDYSISFDYLTNSETKEFYELVKKIYNRGFRDTDLPPDLRSMIYDLCKLVLSAPYECHPLDEDRVLKYLRFRFPNTYIERVFEYIIINQDYSKAMERVREARDGLTQGLRTIMDYYADMRAEIEKGDYKLDF